MKTFKYVQGNLPILVSMPHSGTLLPAEMVKDMTESALERVDTDWHLDRLYQFAAKRGCSVINPVYSRYVIDLNRADSNQSLYPGSDTTELCPTTQFNRQPIYREGRQPTREQISARINTYWRPFHQQLKDALTTMRQQYGSALLFEAHSIKSVVPRFFDGQLADFNFGSYDKKSCSTQLSELIDCWMPNGYSKVVNGRFQGGYITRHYGKPEESIDTLQLELSQATYLDEDKLSYDENKATKVIIELDKLFEDLQSYCFQ